MSRCGICSDFFDGVERIVATPCGHVYHTKCLLKWLDVSAGTCPQCREQVTIQKVVELYFNINNPESVNPLSLCNEIENLKTLLIERRMEASNLYTKNIQLDRLVTEQKSKISSLQLVNMNLEHGLNMSLSEIPPLKSKLEASEKMNVELQSELHFLQDIKTVVAGAQEDSDKILHEAAGRASSSTDLMVSRKLATCCSLTKKELRRVIDDNNKLKKEIIEVKKNLGETSTKMNNSKAWIKELENRIEQMTSESFPYDSFELQECFPSEASSSPRNGISPCKYFQMTPISSVSGKKEKRKINVVLGKEKEEASEFNEGVSPVIFSPLPKHRKETNSLSSTGCYGLGRRTGLILRANDLPNDGKPRKYNLVSSEKKFHKVVKDKETEQNH